MLIYSIFPIWSLIYNDVYKCNLLVVKAILWNTQMLVLSIINLDLNHFTTDTDNVSFLNCFQFKETLYDSFHVIYIICISFTDATFKFTVGYLILLIYKFLSHRMDSNHKMYVIIQNKKWQQQIYCFNPHILQFKAELIWKWSTKWFWKGKLSFSLSLSLSLSYY